MRFRERALEAGVFLLPLVCWPDLEQPFSTPKLWLLGGLAALAFQPRFDRRWLIWPAAVALSGLLAPYVSLQALVLAVLPLPLAWARRERLARALLWAAIAESVIVLLQYAGLDPLRLLGWRPETFAGSRMRVYGTLGNPNFAAAWLCGTLPLFARLPVLAPLPLAAIFATGSRSFLLAAPAIAAIWAVRRARWSRWWLAAAPVLAALLWFSPARSLPATIAGRVSLVRAAAAHWRDVPIAGSGPGSFESRFAQWQPGAAPVDHAHNDYVEFWIEYGAAGLAAFLVLCGWWFRRGWRCPSDAGAWGGLAALLAVALVDFPFHRPAEWGLFWLLMGLIGQRRNENENLA